MIESGRSKVIVGRGPLAVERELLRLVDAERSRRVDELAQPLRIVVPSASLRAHVVRRIAVELGALAGVVVQTLPVAAREVMDRCGEPVRVAGELASILVRRRVAADPTLGPRLSGLDDGYGIVEAAVRDLLDAGFLPEHAEVVADKLADLEGQVTPERMERVAGVVTVAAAVHLELEALETVRSDQLPQRAAEQLRLHGPSVLPSKAVVICGFADLTGVASDFIDALLAMIGGTVLIDRPPDPLFGDRDDIGVRFLERLEVHLGAHDRVESPVEPSRPDRELFRAATADAEAREVAHRVRGLIDRGAEPEDIAVVARDLAGEAAALRRHLDRLAIPVSGSDGVLPGGRAWRQARRLAEVLRRGSELPVEVWLEALEGVPGSTALGVALRSLGVVSLAEAAATARFEAGPLPDSLPSPDVDEGEASRGRPMEPAGLERLLRRASDLVAVLGSWPERATAAAHVELCRKVAEALACSNGPPVSDPVRAALARLGSELPPELELDRTEVVEAARRLLAEVGLEPVGGAGGGVQLLTVMDARGRTFDHLFLVGLNRGRFPRVVQDDALLPDTVRGHLAVEVLPEFPVKARGLDEERYLFAQLSAAARHLTLSWRTTEDGTRVAPSPFVERMLRADCPEVDTDPKVEAVDGVGDLAPRPAFEHAVIAAQIGARAELAPVLAEALIEGSARAGVGLGDPTEWAAARIDVLDALDPLTPGGSVGPWAGLVADGALPSDDELPAVTGLEDTARCPWQAFAVRRLGVSPMPDPRLGLPDLGGPLLGSVVHEILQRVVEEVLGRERSTLEQLAGATGRDVPWPDSDSLAPIVVASARRVAARNGLAASGAAQLLAARAVPVLEVARRLAWPEGIARGVVAVELNGAVAVAGSGVVRFRADRAERDGDRLVLLDYKSGRPLSTAKKPGTRRAHLLRQVELGRMLQAVAYVLGTPQPSSGVGRYLWLRPDPRDAPEASRAAEVTEDDADMVAAFGEAVRIVVSGWRAGGLPPRVEEPDGPGKTPVACTYCPVAQACLRSDSGYRRRLVEWMEGEPAGPSEAERAARELWWLGHQPADEVKR